jgi:hypothetical protein
MILSPPCPSIKHFPERNGKQLQPSPAFLGELNALGIEIEREAKGPALIVHIQTSNRSVAVDAKIAQQFGFVFDFGFSDESEADPMFVLVDEPSQDGFRRQQCRWGPEEIIQDHDSLDREAQFDQIVVELDTPASRRVAPVVLGPQPRYRQIPTEPRSAENSLIGSSPGLTACEDKLAGGHELDFGRNAGEPELSEVLEDGVRAIQDCRGTD